MEEDVVVVVAEEGVVVMTIEVDMMIVTMTIVIRDEEVVDEMDDIKEKPRKKFLLIYLIFYIIKV